MKTWSATGQLDFDPTAIPVLKLHGSIDWLTVNHDQGLPWTDIAESNEFTSSPGTEFMDIIIGNGVRLRPCGPYPDLFAEFRRRLFNATKLGVVGYSFGDDHVNQTIALV